MRPDLMREEDARCPYCEAILRNPPCCCQEAVDAHDSQRLISQLWQDEGGEG